MKPVLREIAILDEILDAHRATIGADFNAYRNHTYRVVNFCHALTPLDSESREKLAIAAAFHDIGIWTETTFDYLPPSMRAATAFLTANGRAQWVDEIASMILEHHKIRAFRGSALIEIFRRADWIDVTFGLRSFGVARAIVRDILETWPNHGFHKRLLQLELSQIRAHPLRPLPMIRL